MELVLEVVFAITALVMLLVIFQYLCDIQRATERQVELLRAKPCPCFQDPEAVTA